MENLTHVLSDTLQALLYLILFFDISARLMEWFGTEHTRTGEFLYSVSDIISFPFRVLLAKFTMRHPFFDGLPRFCGTATVFLMASLLP